MRREPIRRPLDAILLGLRAHSIGYRPDLERPDRWTADCPLCRTLGSLALTEHGDGRAASIRCSTGCDESKIIAALAAEPAGVIVEQLELALRAADDARALAADALQRLAAANTEIDQLRRVIDRAMPDAA